MQSRTMAAALALGSLVGLPACDHDGRVVESPDQMMTPASRFDTEGAPDQRLEQPQRAREPAPPPASEPAPSSAPPRSEIDTDTDTDVEDIPVPPSTEKPPSSGPEIDVELNWIDDSGNTTQ